jgi:uncharacterized DUF497 family protein
MCYTLIVIQVRKLIWDSWNSKHIACHNVTTEEVEAVCHNNPLVIQGQKKNRLVVFNKTDEQRLLGVILEAKEKGIYYPVTAYDADSKDTELFNRLRR